MGMRRVSAALVGLAGFAMIGMATFAAGGGPAHALTNCTVADYSLDSEEQAFLGLINAYRQQNGLNALVISTNLNRDATWMVNDLATNNYFSHTDSLGRSPYARAVDCGYPDGAGENLAAGSSWSTAQAAFDAWKASPGHNANMLFQYYQQIGIARLYSASATYGWYWATEFGAGNDGTGGAPPPPPPTNTPTPAPTNTPAPSPTATQPPANPTPTPTAPAGSSPTAPPPTNTPTPSVTSIAQQPPATATPTQPPAAATPTSSPKATSTPPPTSAPAATATAAGGTPPAPPSLALSPGANLVAWPATDVEPWVALGNDPSIAVVYGYDTATGRWLHYGPGLPGFANNLTMLRQGHAYWVIARSVATLRVGSR
jgi:uncharacterized protein YkwD